MSVPYTRPRLHCCYSRWQKQCFFFSILSMLQMKYYWGVNLWGCCLCKNVTFWTRILLLIFALLFPFMFKKKSFDVNFCYKQNDKYFHWWHKVKTQKRKRKKKSQWKLQCAIYTHFDVSRVLIFHSLWGVFPKSTMVTISVVTNTSNLTSTNVSKSRCVIHFNTLLPYILCLKELLQMHIQ